MTIESDLLQCGGPFYRSRLYGLDITSAIDLHSARRPESDECDVLIERGESVADTAEVPDGDLVVQWTTPHGLRASFVRRPSGEHLLRFQSTCDVVVDASCSTVTVHMVSGVSESMGAVLLAGTVLSYILLLRHKIVLHASAVEVNGEAIAFVGASGMGKTTMATLLCQVGGRLITDDVLHIDRRGSDIYNCFLGATELRLRASAAKLADEFGEDGSHRVTADDRSALSVPLATRESLPLKALIIPRPRRDTDQLSMTRLERATAAISLLSFPRIVGIRDARLLAKQFDQMANLAETTPVFVANVPWGPPFDPDLSSELLRAICSQVEVPRR